MSGWAVVGTGRVAGQMAAAIQRHDDSTLVGVVSRSRDRGLVFATAHGAPQVYSSLEEMLADVAVDVVYVASPNAMHATQVSQSLTAGKHVLCEKPLAMDVASCVEVTQLARQHDRLLGVALQYRQHPAHRQIRDLLARGVFGEPVVADAAVHVPPMAVPDWYGDPTTAGGGVVPMAGVHRIDLLRFVLGADVVGVHALVATRAPERNYEDTVALLLEFDNGCLATLRFVMDVEGWGDGVTVAGTRGWANAEGTTSQWWSDNGGQLSMKHDGTNVHLAFPTQDLYRLQVEDFAAALRGEAEFAATGIDGVRAAQVMAAIFESARTRCRVSVDPSTPLTRARS